MEHFLNWISPMCAVITIVLTFINIWRSTRNRDEAQWLFLEHKSVLEANLKPVDTVVGLRQYFSNPGEPEPDKVIELVNSGDGDAYKLKVTGTGCTAWFMEMRKEGEMNIFSRPSAIHRVKPGDTILLLVFTEAATPEDDVIIDLQWTVRPTRLGKQVHTYTYLQGDEPALPTHPIPEKREHAPTLTRYRFEHLKPLVWIYRQCPGLWNMRFCPFFRTLKKRPSRKQQQDSPQDKPDRQPENQPAQQENQ